jgi:hypothetical protein
MPPKTVKSAKQPVPVSAVPAHTNKSTLPAPAPAAPFCGLQLTHQPPPALAAQVQTWLSQLSPRDLELQRHAAAYLKSSYFPEKTHGFKKWFAALPATK